MFRITLTLAALLLVTSCATGPGTYAVENSRTFNASFGETWDAVIEYFAQNNIPIRTIERDSGVIYAEQMFAGGYDVSFMDFADCGGFTAAVTRRAQFNILVRDAGENQSRVQVTTEFSETQRDFWGGANQVVCVSKGALERNVLNGISLRLR